ncbi:hypothetical protein D4S03_04840 [bacterium]|nr:MAG: hypothetical protein D4S03_04840 [bacterium]
MKSDELDLKLKNAFNDLQNIPPRAPQAAARGRENFLKQAMVFRQVVSRKSDQRHNRWNNIIFPLFQRKERLPVLNTLIAVVLAMSVFFGGTGATVYAAQGSLPDEALYPVKTWSEDAILSLTGPAQMHLNYVLDFSDRRVAEMAGLLAAGKPIPEGVEYRLQNELDLVLELTAGMDDPQAIQQMLQIRTRAETQMQTMTMLMSGAPESAEPILLRTQARLQEQIQLATMGEADPQGFRMKIQQRFQNQGGSGEQTPGTGNNPQDPGPVNPTEMPGPSGTGNGPGPGGNQTTGTPGQYGPGSHTPDRTPQPGGVSGEPTPGTGSNPQGPGPMSPTDILVPTGTSDGPGPGMNQPTGTPGQNGSGSQMPNRTPQPGGGSGHMP